MSRPEFVTNEDLARWDEIIDEDAMLPKVVSDNPIIREACYAGQWLGEELAKLGCSQEKSIRIIFTAGKLSFGRDTWQVSIDMLKAYKEETLEYEQDPLELN